jgi:hypothetical protein
MLRAVDTNYEELLEAGKKLDWKIFRMANHIPFTSQNDSLCDESLT